MSKTFCAQLEEFYSRSARAVAPGSQLICTAACSVIRTGACNAMRACRFVVMLDVFLSSSFYRTLSRRLRQCGSHSRTRDSALKQICTCLRLRSPRFRIWGPELGVSLSPFSILVAVPTMAIATQASRRVLQLSSRAESRCLCVAMRIAGAPLPTL